jgi:hypothetical protein
VSTGDQDYDVPCDEERDEHSDEIEAGYNLIGQPHPELHDEGVHQ